MTDTRRDDRLDWLERVIDDHLRLYRSVVDSPARKPDDADLSVLAAWKFRREVLDRHGDCGVIGYCDDGGHDFEDPPFGCADLEGLLRSLRHYPGFDPDWMHCG